MNPSGQPGFNPQMMQQMLGNPNFIHQQQALAAYQQQHPHMQQHMQQLPPQTPQQQHHLQQQQMRAAMAAQASQIQQQQQQQHHQAHPQPTPQQQKAHPPQQQQTPQQHRTSQAASHHYGGGPGPGPGPAGPTSAASGSSATPHKRRPPSQQAATGASPAVMAAMHPSAADEEDTSHGDILDFITPREIAMHRYGLMHEYMEEIFSSPYHASQIYDDAEERSNTLLAAQLNLTKSLFKPTGKPADGIAREDACKQTGERAEKMAQDIENEMKKLDARHLRIKNKFKERGETMRQINKEMRLDTFNLWNEFSKESGLGLPDVDMANLGMNASAELRSQEELVEKVESLYKINIDLEHETMKIVQKGQGYISEEAMAEAQAASRSSEFLMETSPTPQNAVGGEFDEDMSTASGKDPVVVPVVVDNESKTSTPQPPATIAAAAAAAATVTTAADPGALAGNITATSNIPENDTLMMDVTTGGDPSLDMPSGELSQFLQSPISSINTTPKADVSMFATDVPVTTAAESSTATNEAFAAVTAGISPPTVSAVDNLSPVAHLPMEMDTTLSPPPTGALPPAIISPLAPPEPSPRPVAKSPTPMFEQPSPQPLSAGTAVAASTSPQPPQLQQQQEQQHAGTPKPPTIPSPLPDVVIPAAERKSTTPPAVSHEVPVTNLTSVDEPPTVPGEESVPEGFYEEEVPKSEVLHAPEPAVEPVSNSEESVPPAAAILEPAVSQEAKALSPTPPSLTPFAVASSSSTEPVPEPIPEAVADAAVSAAAPPTPPPPPTSQSPAAAAADAAKEEEKKDEIMAPAPPAP